MSKETFNYQNISKINNYIYIGSAEHPIENSDEFSKLKIDVCINCTKEINYPNTYLIVEKIPIDESDISYLECMDMAINKIIYHLNQKRKIYIHCDKGISRSPSILIYYLMAKQHMSYDNAYKVVKKVRPIIKIDPLIENHLRTIEEI